MKKVITWLEKITTWLDGKKTYLGAIALFISGGFLATGVIDQKTFETITTIIAAWTAFGIRSALKKLE